MHHLKTMAEAFIYFYVVSKDTSDRTAREVLADAADRKANFLKANAAVETEMHEWRDFRDEFWGTDGAGLRDLAALARAHSHELSGWYDRVYRLACEPRT